MKTYYHFTTDKLRNCKPIPKIGEWLSVKGKLKPCEWGLHASKHPFDALIYAPGNLLHKVELGGKIIPHGNDKVVARKRKIIATIDAAKLCNDFARRVALDVIHLWKAPAIVKKYLETGDESIRIEARCAAYGVYIVSATCGASAAYAAYAVSGAYAFDTIYIYAAYAAVHAGGDKKKYRRWFLRMVEKAFQTNV